MKRSGFRRACGALWLLLLLALPQAAVAQETAPPQRLRVQLMWYHQAQFAGFYMAEALGYYENEGLEVELLQGGLGKNPIGALADGEAEVAMSWLPAAVAARSAGQPVVNVAQLFARAGIMILCRRDAGIRQPGDVAGKRIGVWNVGDELDLRYWLSEQGIAPDGVTVVEQRPNGADLIDGVVDCAMAMTYNEYWHVLRAGLSPADLMVIRLADEGLGFLEDGLYVQEASLEDPEKAEALAAFLRASVAGWQYARDNPEEALTVTLLRAPGLDALHQRSMLEAVLRLLGPGDRLGLLELPSLEHSLAVIGARGRTAAEIDASAQRIWTHRLWYLSGLGEKDFLEPTLATRHYLVKAVGSLWFYSLTLIGTAAFALSGFMRAQQQNYDLWGAFMLAMMPALGGGTLRDLLIAGDRHPPFIFQDAAYISVVLAMVALGAVAARFTHANLVDSPGFLRAKALFDMVGMATYAAIGAQVAILAGLAWVWAPFCAALTCAGGGMLMDVITGREPRTFQGVPYEEIAVGGGLLLLLGLELANAYEHQGWLVGASLLAAMAFVFCLRLWCMNRGVVSWRVGARTQT